MKKINLFFLTTLIFLSSYVPVQALQGSVCGGTPTGWDFLDGGMSPNVTCDATPGPGYHPYCCPGGKSNITVKDSSQFIDAGCPDYSYNCPGNLAEPCTPGSVLLAPLPGRLVIEPSSCRAGSCGSANGVPRTSAPTSNLCSQGSASAVSGTGPWTWSCNGAGGGNTASCSAPVACTYVASVTTWSTCGSGDQSSYAEEVVYATNMAISQTDPACVDAPIVRSCPACAATDVSYLSWQATSSATGYGVFKNSPWTTPLATTTSITYAASSTLPNDDMRVKGFTMSSPTYGADVTPTMTSNSILTGLTDVTVTMTSNTLPTPQVASADSESDSSHRAWRGFDNTDNDWLSNGATGWLKLDLGTGVTKTVRQYDITSGSNGKAPKDFTFQGSNDNTNWTTLDTRTGEISWSSETRSFAFTNGTAYRYYRLN